MKIIDIKLKNNSYQVKIGENNFVKTLITECSKIKFSKVLFVIDKNIQTLHSEILEELFSKVNFNYHKILIHSSEQNKSLKSLQRIYNFLINKNYNRDSLIIAIGGGIVGDLAGFAAATYTRGIPFIQVPTSLLACVDSSVGGKTGINFQSTKNIIGAFHQPKAVIIDVNFLKSLPKEELVCGLGEIIKYGFLSDPKFLNKILSSSSKILSCDVKTISLFIKKSVEFKSSVVAADEKEASLRMILNLGHTFAHAFESEQKNKIKHGQAVIAGILCALNLSVNEKIISPSIANKYINELLFLKDFIDIKKTDRKKLLNVMSRDKKNKDGKIKFVLLGDIGKIILDYESKRANILKAIDKTLETLD